MLLVYGPRSASYDFGPGHPLTPRRFGPGLDLLRAVGAEPGLAPEPAPDEELLWCHTRRYLETVRRFSEQPFGGSGAGISEGGDVPPFAGMHEAGAMVAGGSLRAVEAILRGDVEHAFHPGGGLHHAMPDRASGFCIYDDVALAIARARQDGLRVLYVDLDVHHGDGVQAIHWSDPGVLTVSVHESGRYLFPGTGGVGELGEGAAAGTSVNVPLEPGTGEAAWSAAVRGLLPELAAAFGPDLIVSQHGADSHAWDPLAHLRVTTTAMGEAARLVDLLAHRYAAGRWLATGGGGYDAYRVVPRSWSLVWLAGAHREVPATTPPAWRDRWAAEAARYGQAPLPEPFDDAPNAGQDRTTASWPPRRDRWRRPRSSVALSCRGSSRSPGIEAGGTRSPTLVARGRERHPQRRRRQASDGRRSSTRSMPSTWARLTLAPRVIAPADAAAGHGLVLRGDPRRRGRHGRRRGDPGRRTGRRRTDRRARADAKSWRSASPRRSAAAGWPAALLGACVSVGRPGDLDHAATVTVAERDPVEPLDVALRGRIARRLLEEAGFRVGPADDPGIRAADPSAVSAMRSRLGAAT